MKIARGQELHVGRPQGSNAVQWSLMLGEPLRLAWALKRSLRRAAMTMGGCCLAMRMCRLSSCARSIPRAVLLLHTSGNIKLQSLRL